MADIVCDIKDFRDIFSKNELARLHRAEAAAFDAAQIGVSILQAAAPHDTGALALSMHAERGAGGTATIAIDSPYANEVEFGSLPHRPPIAPLLAWAERHGMDDGVAWAIAAKIEKEGTKPTFFIRNSMGQLKDAFLQIIMQHLEDR